MEVLRGVPVLRVVAAADVAALPAQAQMHPRVTHLQALLAAARVALVGLDGSRCVQEWGMAAKPFSTHIYISESPAPWADCPARRIPLKSAPGPSRRMPTGGAAARVCCRPCKTIPRCPRCCATLQPAALARLVDRVGLNDAGELMALAPTHNLLQALDESLWKSPQPGGAESSTPTSSSTGWRPGTRSAMPSSPIGSRR